MYLNLQPIIYCWKEIKTIPMNIDRLMQRTKNRLVKEKGIIMEVRKNDILLYQNPKEKREKEEDLSRFILKRQTN